MKKGIFLVTLAAGLAAGGFAIAAIVARPGDAVKDGFLSPPDSSRPGVYWYFTDGNIDRKGITGDLESMKEAGIGYVLFLEVDVGVPRGTTGLMSEAWQNLFAHAVREAERLGIRVIMGSGPGWAGSGGPWVEPGQSMTHLVASATEAKGPSEFDAVLAVPAPKKPFFGENSVPADLARIREAWYEDVAVLAFPTPPVAREIPDYEEKALFYRAPYTSQAGVKPYLPAPAVFREAPGTSVDMNRIVDLTDKLGPGGRLAWRVPEGTWTIMRFGRRNNGAVTRPAPVPGLGFECDKFDAAAFDSHFEAYLGKLLDKTGLRKAPAAALARDPYARASAAEADPQARLGAPAAGWTTIHMDSWEMGAQNWSPDFRAQFRKRRGYDPLPYLPSYTGRIVDSLERSERFLWDLRKTSNELIIENHAGRFKELGRRFGFDLSIEPYDMNPAADLDLGAVADVPMGEFWSDGFGFNAAFSCIEATSIAHVHGRPVVAAEAFTANGTEAWKLAPGALKNQGDWAFAMGINRFVYHTFAHKSFFDELRPGMTMGPYGVHWDRGQTWWSMAGAYHRYISRCQFLLSRGRTVSDILYLAPEGAPHVFRAPLSALEGTAVLPDKREYAFDGCSPSALDLASVRDGRIVFPGGASYRILVLPAVQTMTPELLEKIGMLVREGAVVAGTPPLKSPSLVDYPECDRRVKALAEDIWGGFTPPSRTAVRRIGRGRVLWGGEFAKVAQGEIYPSYGIVAAFLDQDGVRPDFTASGAFRYAHRTLPEREIYFVSNRTDLTVTEKCVFRDGTRAAELWDAVSGRTRPLAGAVPTDRGISIEIRLEPYESCFVVFAKNGVTGAGADPGLPDFPVFRSIGSLDGPWTVSFDPKWGGPERIVFDRLEDWSKRPEDGIRYYSGRAVYSRAFDLPDEGAASAGSRLVLDLGEVKDLARVRLNGKDLGVVWTAPWRVEITTAARARDNKLEIEVANLWPNRLIGDEALPDDGAQGGRWPDWLLNGTPRTSGRFTFTSSRLYKKDDPLLPSGLLGPVTIAAATVGVR